MTSSTACRPGTAGQLTTSFLRATSLAPGHGRAHSISMSRRAHRGAHGIAKQLLAQDIDGTLLGHDGEVPRSRDRHDGDGTRLIQEDL